MEMEIMAYTFVPSDPSWFKPALFAYKSLPVFQSETLARFELDRLLENAPEYSFIIREVSIKVVY